MSTVTVLSKLPHGITMELGYEMSPSGHFIRTPAYRAVTLNGANQHSRVLDSQGNRTVSPLQFQPGVTENVDEEFITEWMRAHAESGMVRNGLISIVKKGDVKDASKDLTQQTIGLEPIDPSKVRGIAPRSEE